MLFKSQPPSSFGQWITDRRGPGSFSPSMRDRGSVWGKESGRRAHLESCVCARVRERPCERSGAAWGRMLESLPRLCLEGRGFGSGFCSQVGG